MLRITTLVNCCASHCKFPAIPRVKGRSKDSSPKREAKSRNKTTPDTSSIPSRSKQLKILQGDRRQSKAPSTLVRRSIKCIISHINTDYMPRSPG